MQKTPFSYLLSTGVLSACLALTGCQQTATQTPSTTLSAVKVDTIGAVASHIPTPSQMRAEVIASGRVSTLKHIDIRKVGKQIPYTYSDGKINNSPGFDWYVSKHFALKSDRPTDQVKLYLELLEMSYPHYVELFGYEPANIENQRIAAVYGSSKSATKIFVTDDGLQRGISAGGETMYYNLAGYSYPSAREQHQRYIVIHEQGHAFQMALMDYPGWLPTWFTEGTADALAHHYYDPNKKQLKVMVFDRGSPMDYIRLGLKQYQQLGQPTILDMTANPELYRGINFLIVHFMLDDPKRSHLFKAYRDEMARLRKSADNNGEAVSQQIMSDIFGDWGQIEQDFATYVASVDKTFNIAAGPWEQDGNQYWVRTLNNHFEHGSPRLDVYLKPGDKARFNPLKIDQPLPPSSELIGKVGRGTETPSLAIEIAYQRDHLHRGHVGMALAVELAESAKPLLEADKKVGAFDQKSYNPDGDHALNIKIDRGETLLIEGQSIGADNISFALPFELIEALEAQSNPTLGLNVSIEQRELIVTLTSDAVENQRQQFIAKYPINQQTRHKLLNRHIAILAENAEHRITPYFDDGRDLNPYLPDLTQPAPVNPWRNPADKALSRLIRANWRLADKAPVSLNSLADEMIAATTKGPQAQRQSLQKFNQQLPTLVQRIRESGQTDDLINQALIELSGLQLRMEWQKVSEDDSRAVDAVLYNHSNQPALTKLAVTQAQQEITNSGPVKIATSQRLRYITSPQTRQSGAMIDATASVNWLGANFTLTSQSEAQPYPWSSMAIVQPAQSDGHQVSIVSELRGPHAGETKGKMIVKAYPSHLFVEATIEQDIDIKPYEIRQFASIFTLKPGVTAQPYAVDVSYQVEIDGEPVLLKQRSAVQF